jgi:hypothetical protein
VSIVLFITISIFGYRTIKTATEAQKYKGDYAEINHFKHGLLSVDEWKQQLSVIIGQEIDSLALTKQNEKVLKTQLENQLGVLIDKVVERIEKKNSQSFTGKMKLTLMDSFVDVKDVKAGIPGYADAMIAEINKNKTQAQIKSMLKTKINKYIDETYDVRTVSTKDMIISKMQAQNEAQAGEMIREAIAFHQRDLEKNAVIILSLSVILFIIVRITKGDLSPLQYTLMTLTLIVLLITGVSTPMIDMEAKITSLNFMLLNHPIRFDNQVLFFQTKSVINVFWLMWNHKDYAMKAVGFLMVGFSVIFPIMKMLSSLVYFTNVRNARKSKVINFLVMKTGKWSMADVMVIAIFMSFIGFNGIVNAQLEQLRAASPDLDLLTTNGTNLQPGFYLFFGYVILAMFFSSMLQAHCDEHGQNHEKDSSSDKPVVSP